MTKARKRFHTLCVATLAAVYFLVLVGGIVRSTGSGMGCPDWPTCFGNWIPPTSVSQLPPDYKEQYASYRQKKNEKFARYLSLTGFGETARQLLDDKSVLVEADFNAAKTWVEYLNRVVGVVIGLFIIALAFAGWRVRSESPALFKGAAWLLVLVIFQGWFGSIVVSTNLTAWTVTVHMFLALVMVALLVWLLVRSGEDERLQLTETRPWFIGMMAVMLVQIFLGTQVREALDLAASSVSREGWIGAAGFDFILHRSFSWTVIIMLGVIWFKLRKTTTKKALYLVPIVLILASALSGLGMAWFAVPPFLQPLHLLLAVVTFGWFMQAYLLTVEPGLT